MHHIITHIALRALLFALLLAPPLYAQQKQALTFTDLMQFRQIRQQVISEDGAWVAFTARPDRGDSEVIIRSTQGDTRYTVPSGSDPVIAADGRFVAVRRNPTLAETEAAKDKPDQDKPKRGLVLVNTATGAQQEFDRIDAFAFSADGLWLAYHAFESEAGPETDASEMDTEEEQKKKGKRKTGTRLTLHKLATAEETPVEAVRSFAFDEEGQYVAYAVASEDSTRDGLYVRDLKSTALAERVLDARPFGHYGTMAWSEAENHLAFVVATEDEGGKPGNAALSIWDGGSTRETTAAEAAPEGWRIPAKNTLRWTRDGERLFFGYRPEEPEEETAAEDSTAAFDPYDTDAILADRGVDVWHWNDPRINPNQKRVWKQEQERTYEAVYHVEENRAVPLADEEVLSYGFAENPHVMLGRAYGPYHKYRTWEGNFFDSYLFDLNTGERTKVGERLSNVVSLSPGGRYVVYYYDHQWHLYDIQNTTTRTLTDQLRVPFGNEDHDYPSQVPGYGLGGWVADDAAVLIYDKYDIWYVPTDGGEAFAMTEGRAAEYTFRVIRTDPEKTSYDPDETVLLSSYHNMQKHYGFYEAKVGRTGVKPLLEEERRFRFLAKAKKADIYLYTREDYDEFPDLWVSRPDFQSPRKVSDLGQQLEPFAWGTSELVSWTSVDGTPMQGVLIKPGNYEPGKRYPVFVYFYRFMSNRLHWFNEPVVNHRPSFPLYASNDYIVFLPDVRFEVGRPGFSATKSIVPGVQKLVEMGLADPDALGLHGHSWSGYQTAFMVTQTDIFKAAIAGAPVSNMTSAYGGIRWSTGLARQFQYEKTQSRLGATLWEERDRYIDNSPLFFADRVNTPILIIHGDEDGAVPWYQSIEFYLALRRLGKEAVFLQYRGEGHHPAAYANKLDWAIKMKQYFDHYLKGAPAPAWITEGVPYNGE